MSRIQRLFFLGIAAVIAVVAVVVLAGGGDEDPTATRDAPPLLRSGKVTLLQYTEGQTVRFRVTSDVPEEVHVHGYDIARDLEPGKVVTVSFKATIPGIFEIEYEHAGEEIGRLRVDPG